MDLLRKKKKMMKFFFFFFLDIYADIFFFLYVKNGG